MAKENPEVQCPTCQKPIQWSDQYPHRPFCCKRCQLIDLGEWASENHKIPGIPLYDDVLSEDIEPNKRHH
ncbi:MAG: DNA gyrase inhibitor YacG [Gammaproteobacteria bacterium]|nr:DNA gyrase inhibitor YacG [Gammaproteobacteria bacterium]